MYNLPITIVATTVSTYWLAVLLMVARSWIRFRGPAGLVPKLRWERYMWLVWVPSIVAWIVLPWQASKHAVLGDLPWSATMIRYIAALLAVAALALTTHCWLAMGSNWSMAITPRKSTSLIRSGAFGLVRHPIYALSLLLMLSTVITVASWPMLLVGAIHTAMIVFKTLSEERYLRELHGAAYDHYCQLTGRYFPSLRGLLHIFSYSKS